MNYFQNLDLLFVGLVLAANGILGYTVFLSNKKSATNRTFFIFVISTIPWGVFNYFMFQSVPKNLAIWILRGHVFFAVWYCFSLFRLFYIFPNSEKLFPKFYYIFILPIVIFTALITLTPFVFEQVTEFSLNGGIERVSNGLGIIIFGITIISLTFYSIYILWKKFANALDIDKPKFLLLLTGVGITFSLHIIFNFLMPVFFNNPNFAPFGSAFIFPFIIFASYAILRYKLFNIRVLGTAILVFFLSVVSFLEVVFADNIALVAYRMVVLIVILLFGILLIKGVLREVRHREEIATMAEDVKRAYVVEKKAKEEIEKLDKFKDQFLMTAQHNLRTPLTSMMGYADLMLKGMFGKQNKKTTEVIKKFQLLTQSMIKMVNDFLDMAQFQLGKSVINLKPDVELLPILDEIENELTFKAESKGVYLKLEKPKEIYKVVADREKLKAALFNIVDNAVKYTEKGGVTVEVKNLITTGSQEIKKLRITVKDTGIGIPKEKLSTIFEQMFERTEHAKRVTSVGSGVGLYLSGQVIKSHNGKVWAESEGDGKGSEFIVELPLSQNITSQAASTRPVA